jgi:transcriptional regulator with XRE-family HTH domain
LIACPDVSPVAQRRWGHGELFGDLGDAEQLLHRNTLSSVSVFNLQKNYTAASGSQPLTGCTVQPVSESTITSGDQLAARFAVRLRQVRIQQDMSQAALAREASAYGVTLRQTTVAKIENGQRGVRLEEGWALARALSVRFEYLLGEQFDERSTEQLEEELASLIEETQAALATVDDVRNRENELRDTRRDAERATLFLGARVGQIEEELRRRRG